jgi:predicted metal-dependent peptidase
MYELPSGEQRREHGDKQTSVVRHDLDEALIRLRNYIVRGILNDEYVPVFFSHVRKVFSRLGGAAAAVTMTENGIKLICDIDFVCEASDETLDFVLSHELIHVLNLHFLRGFDLMEELQIPKREFYSYYCKYADLPVNNSLSSMAGYQKMQDGMLIYDSIEAVNYWDHPTFESIVHYMYANYPPQPGMAIYIEGENGEGGGGDSDSMTGGTPTVIIVKEDGSAKTIQDGGDGSKVVVIPEVEKESQREHFQNVKDLVESADKLAGTAPVEIRDAIKQFIDMYDNTVIKGWALLERYLTGFRTINKGRLRTFRKLNRRTGLLPGRRHIKGFRVLWLVDESGSMSDEEVATALALGKRAIMRENSDKMYYIHWDTEPSSQVEEIKTVRDIENVVRQKQGGTDFRGLFSHPLVLKQDVDIYVVVTDGWPCAWPDTNSRVPHIWIITDGSGYQKWKTDYHKGIAVDVSEG